MIGHDAQGIVRSWVQSELARWALDIFPVDQFGRLIGESGPAGKSVFVYQIDRDGRVSSDRGVNVDRLDEQSPAEMRRRMYNDFFQVCSDAHGLADIVFAVDVGDGGLSWKEAPLFSFQKSLGQSNLLVPDIDFLHWDFYQQMFDEHRDILTYEEKAPRAVFVGSTTGGGIIDAAALAANSIPRIAAARFFKADPAVDFLLPNVVQCLDRRVEDLIRREGYSSEVMSWPQQLQNRFVLSMDGNGATCSRVAIALRSNSALIKYHSKHILYYFRGLRPWVEYLPVDNEADVVDILSIEQRNKIFFSSVAENGTAFARTYLNKDCVVYYMAQLLIEYRVLCARGK